MLINNLTKSFRSIRGNVFALNNISIEILDGEFFVLLGAGYTLAAKLAWTTGFLLSAWGAYRLVHHWLSVESPALHLGRQRTAHLIGLSALVAGLLYIYIPYRLLDIYVRAALNDALLLAWYPWVFLAFDRLIASGFSRGWQSRLALAILALALFLSRVFRKSAERDRRKYDLHRDHDDATDHATWIGIGNARKDGSLDDIQ